MSEKSILDPELVFWDLQGNDAKDCLRFLGNALENAGKAKGDYTDAVLEREIVYPTGLQTPSLPIAIPHANPSNAIENAFAVAKLKEPVMFRHMADEEQEVPVELIFMMCIVEPQIHAPLLRKILEAFSVEGMEKEIYSCRNSNELYELLQKKTGV